LKAIHAALASKGDVSIFPDVPRGPNDYRLIYDSAGYERHIAKVALGTWQMMLVSRMPGFLPVLCPASLWGRLTSETFTTPLLKSWLPWIQKELERRELLLPLRCFNCACGWLKATSDDLDEIVSEGLKTKKLVIA
jgi:hypothetical protein